MALARRKSCRFERILFTRCKRRWPNDFICPGCSEHRVAVLKSRPRLYECLDCGRQTSITAGAAMHHIKMPLAAWFWAARC
ncbi:MAG: transposase [Methylocella sp.]